MKNFILRVIHETHKAQVRACLKAVSDHQVASIFTVSALMVCCIVLSIPQMVAVFWFFVPLAASTALCVAAALFLNFLCGDIQRFCDDGCALKEGHDEANSVDRLSENAWDSQFGQYTTRNYREDERGEVGVGKSLDAWLW